ncbi:DUF4097 family beta strand repeat-containing protein [Amycolatopsis sp. 195334CR]|uniref:DUF4097 family beta strand repeat-containing protein n=1 Tax=Amycolatopsis sp. 195334CR TaxID=2814588 RepID=UPI001A8ED08A|nr:hypothetical protein [Amycolatopsis sp. 195334CR]MBN6035792.1 hypothetical protein [Amycolatopsis sp. 195334CR]
MGKTGWVLTGVAASALVLAGCDAIAPQEEFSDGTPVPDQITSVRFDVPAGEVKIRVEQGAPVSLRRDVHYRGTKPGQSHRVEGTTLVLDKCGSDCSVNYDVVIPAALPVSGSASAGNVTITGAGATDVDASAGNVVLGQLAGPANVTASAGNVEVGLATPADARVKASAGTVTVTVPQGTYRVTTEANAGDSHVSVPNTPGAPHVVDVAASAGDVTVRTA